MITRIAFSNFRLLRDVSITIEQGVPVVLIGPNGSGKSSVLEAIEILRKLATHPTGSVFMEGAHGAYKNILTVGESGTLKFEVDITPQPPLRHFPLNTFIRHAVELSLSNRTGDKAAVPLIASESIALLNIDTKKPIQASPFLRRTNERDGRSKIHLVVHDDATKPAKTATYQVGQDHLAVGDIPADVANIEIIKCVRDELRGMRIYPGFDVAPKWVRSLRSDKGSNTSARAIAPMQNIYNISVFGSELVNSLMSLQTRKSEIWQRIQRHFFAEFPHTGSVGFPPEIGSQGRLTVEWHDKRFSEGVLGIEEMSDGMVAYLCILVASFTPDTFSLIGFEEPERYFHPKLQRRIMHCLHKASENKAVFVTTHSNQLLDYLGSPQRSIWVCTPSKNGTDVGRMDKDTFEEWLKEYSVSELRRQGQLDDISDQDSVQ